MYEFQTVLDFWFKELKPVQWYKKDSSLDKKIYNQFYKIYLASINGDLAEWRNDPKGLLGSIGFHPDEHKALSRIKAWGFVDVFRLHHPDEKAYTFWDYRIPYAVRRGLGWRIDHIWATQSLADKSKRIWIDVAST